MAKKITSAQLSKALSKAPHIIKTEGKNFISRGLLEIKRVAGQSSPWRVGQAGGGIPIAHGNLKQRHRTRITGLEGRFGVGNNVKYAVYVHEGTRKMQKRPWLEYAKKRSEKQIERHYNKFLDEVFKIIAS